MSPVFMNEYLSRRDYYEKKLAEAGLGIDGQTDEQKLGILQDFRISQYEKLCDVVYAEKGYDRDGIPLKSKLLRLGFREPEYLAIVEQARQRCRQPVPRESDEKIAN
jgi:hypothetical protein